MTQIRAYIVIFIVGLVLLTGDQQTEAGLSDAFSSFVNLAIGQRPNNENGTDWQFKDQALSDHTNDEIYESTAQDIIERSGFLQNTYEVVSDDGYITQMINIVNPLADKESMKQPPIMIYHGGISDVNLWIWASAIQHHPEKYPRSLKTDGPITSKNRSMAFMLANNGFDVWLIGTRGSGYPNLGHTKYQAALIEDLLLPDVDRFLSSSGTKEFIDTIKYYDYSMDDIVEFELPRQIDAVLKLTGSTEVSVISASFSTQLFFTLLASNRAYSKKIYSHVAIVPILNSIGTNKIYAFILKLAPIVPTPLGVIFMGVILSRPVRRFLKNLDRYGLYKNFLTLLLGPSATYQTFLEDPVVGHLLLPTGFREIQHSSQQMSAGQLQKYDYGSEKNLIKYGTEQPPVHDLSKIKLKRWMILSGANDIMGTQNSGKQYIESIPTKPYRHIIVPGYNHLDMLAAFDNDVKVNLPVLKFFRKHAKLG